METITAGVFNGLVSAVVLYAFLPDVSLQGDGLSWEQAAGPQPGPGD